MIFGNLLLQNELPFQTIERTTQADWFGLTLFFLGLIFLIVLLYRNPVVLLSLISRVFKRDTEKLYFSAPAIDSFDRILLYLIYLSSSIMCIHFFVEQEFDSSWRLLLYLLPLCIVLYFSLPFYLTASIIGFPKFSRIMLSKQSHLLFLFGMLLLPVGGFLFFETDVLLYVKYFLATTLLIFIVWMHLRVFRELIVSGFSVYYIFLYFCTLEILPTATLWVFITRF